MVAITQNRATIHSYTGASTRNGVAGEVLTPGSAVYLKAADNKYWTADNTTAATAVVAGISLTASATDGPVKVQIAGSIDVGATLTAGLSYWLGEADEIVPQGDVGTGDYATLLGLASTTSALDLNILVTGVASP